MNDYRACFCTGACKFGGGCAAQNNWDDWNKDDTFPWPDSKRRPYVPPYDKPDYDFKYKFDLINNLTMPKYAVRKYKNKDHYSLVVELLGFTEEEISVNIIDSNIFKIEAKKNESFKSETNHICGFKGLGSKKDFSFKFNIKKELPVGLLDEDDVTVKYEGGLLTISFVANEDALLEDKVKRIF